MVVVDAIGIVVPPLLRLLSRVETLSLEEMRVEADVARVESGVRLEVLRQLVVNSRDVGLHWGCVVGESSGEVSSVVT